MHISHLDVSQFIEQAPPGGNHSNIQCFYSTSIDLYCSCSTYPLSIQSGMQPSGYFSIELLPSIIVDHNHTSHGWIWLGRVEHIIQLGEAYRIPQTGSSFRACPVHSLQPVHRLRFHYGTRTAISYLDFLIGSSAYY